MKGDSTRGMDAARHTPRFQFKVRAAGGNAGPFKKSRTKEPGNRIAQYEKYRAECRAAGHPVAWHWADGRPRQTCGFCGDPLDHSKCPRPNCELRHAQPTIDRPTAGSKPADASRPDAS